ncbi:MAG: hypothetical protein HY287_04245 [Planctomycetes bacterium]|nr:hypothetical protein [Planctomycetota bacterium]MBI3833524.1 hypothetical protein [Planctomycetota bacterium]
MSDEIATKQICENSVSSEDSANQCVHDLHERQACVSKILEKVFRPLEECDPKLWRRRAYLLLIAIVYERMAMDRSEISTKELTELAKVLTQNDGKGRKGRSPKANSKTRVPTAENGAALHEAVRELYGTNLK